MLEHPRLAALTAFRDALIEGWVDLATQADADAALLDAPLWLSPGLDDRFHSIDLAGERWVHAFTTPANAAPELRDHLEFAEGPALWSELHEGYVSHVVIDPGSLDLEVGEDDIVALAHGIRVERDTQRLHFDERVPVQPWTLTTLEQSVMRMAFLSCPEVARVTPVLVYADPARARPVAVLEYDRRALGELGARSESPLPERFHSAIADFTHRIGTKLDQAWMVDWTDIASAVSHLRSLDRPANLVHWEYGR